MPKVLSEDLDNAITLVLEQVEGINELYPVQIQLLQALVKMESVFFTSATNSGKTLPAVIFPYILDELIKLGYQLPSGKVLFVTPLNSIQMSMVSTVKSLGLASVAVTSTNFEEVISSSETKVVFISPEVMKIPLVSSCLLTHRNVFVLKGLFSYKRNRSMIIFV